MSKHKNLSIFVPHAGCKNQCSFCDQRSISGTQETPTAEYVTNLCDTFLPKDNAENYEIAFFGGSFTAIDSEYMIQLLNAAYPFIKAKRASGIRVSTRPDAINQDVLKLLKQYGVTSIELGAQSMQDDVLRLNKRGHTVQEVYTASELIKKQGFCLGLQMMVGLYGQTDYKKQALDTAYKFVDIKPDTVRIYPTVTLKGTLLEALYLQGEYCPATLNQTVEICTQLMEIFNKNDIKIIKLGLHSDTNMQQKIVAGAYHPALKELCQSQLFFQKIKQQLTTDGIKRCIIKVNPYNLSQVKGQKNSNIQKFDQCEISVQIKADKTIEKGNFAIETINF